MSTRDHGILHVISGTQRRGAEVFATELHEALEGRGIKGEVVALVDNADDGLDVHSLGDTRFAPEALLELRQRMRKASVVVGHGSSSLPACALAGMGVRTPFVYRSIGDPAYWSGSPATRWRVKVFLRRATRVVALTDGAAAALVGRYRADPRRIRVIPKGASAARVDTQVAAADREAVRAALRIEVEAPVAVCIGSLSSEKNPGLLLDALLDRAAPERLHVVFVGDGPLRSELELRATTLAGRVHFTGSVPDPATFLAAGDVLAIPSRTEGMPGSAIEAGFAAKPVVTTDVGWVSYIVLDGRTGRVVPSGEPAALAAALADALAHAETWGARGRVHCLERFEIGVVVERWIDLLSELKDLGGRVPDGE